MNTVDSILIEFLAGKNTVLPMIQQMNSQMDLLSQKMSMFGKALTQDFSNAMGRGSTLKGIYKELGIEMAQMSRLQSKAFGGKAKGPTTQQLFGGLTEDTNFLNKIKGYGQALAQLQADGIPVNQQLKDMESLFGKNSQRMKAFNTGMQLGAKRAKEMANRFDMNTLSWMFGGMALQRVGLMMTRFMIPAMDKLEKLNTEGSKRVMGMAAAFEFLKISIFETLSNTPLFKQFVEWIIKGALWLSEFAQKHPAIVEIAAGVGAIATVLGTMGIGVGIFKQLTHLLKLLGPNGLIVGGIAAVGVALALIEWNYLTENPEEARKIWKFWEEDVVDAFSGAKDALDDLAKSFSDNFNGIEDAIGFTTNTIFKTFLVGIKRMALALSEAIYLINTVRYGIKSLFSINDKEKSDGYFDKAAEQFEKFKEVNAKWRDWSGDMDFIFGDSSEGKTNTPEVGKGMVSSLDILRAGFEINSEKAQNLQESIFNMSKESVKQLGDKDKSDSVIGKFNSFGLLIDGNEYSLQNKFTKLSDDISTWTKKTETKYIDVVYRTKNESNAATDYANKYYNEQKSSIGSGIGDN